MKITDQIQWRRLKSNKGLSILEVLIATLLTGIVLAAVFSLYINQHKNWTTQGEITEMQQNARASIDELSRQIRMAGHQLPIGLEGVEAYNTNPDTIIINYSDDGCYAPIEHSMPLPSSELRCDGHDVSCFYAGQFVYIFHPDSGGGEFFRISHVQTGSSHIQHNDWPLSKCYAKDAIIIALNRIKFYIDNTTDPEHPKLMMELPFAGAQIYADDITDLQFQYRMKNNIIVDVPAIADDVREVMIDITARTHNPDYDQADTAFIFREYSSRVNLRNLDI